MVEACNSQNRLMAAEICKANGIIDPNDITRIVTASFDGKRGVGDLRRVKREVMKQRIINKQQAAWKVQRQGRQRCGHRCKHQVCNENNVNRQDLLEHHSHCMEDSIARTAASRTATACSAANTTADTTNRRSATKCWRHSKKRRLAVLTNCPTQRCGNVPP